MRDGGERKNDKAMNLDFFAKRFDPCTHAIEILMIAMAIEEIVLHRWNPCHIFEMTNS